MASSKRTFCYAYGVDGKVNYGNLGHSAVCPSDPSRNVYEDLFSAKLQLEHYERKLAELEGREPREVFVWPFDTATDTFTASALRTLRRIG